MVKPKFKLIEGNKGKSLRPANMQFISSYATNTRLMGAMAMYIHWQRQGKDFFQIFHFDVEEYGLDNYRGIKGEEGEEFVLEKASLMGGLGGSYRRLNEKESVYLVSRYIRYNQERNIPLPDPHLEYAYLYDEKILAEYEENKEMLKQLQDKLCESIVTDYQLINYFMMRSFASDEEGILYLTEGKKISVYDGLPGTLLKNEISQSDGKENAYICEALMELNDQYKMYVIEVEIEKNEKFMIQEAKALSTMNVSSIEASFMLNREENIDIYSVADKEKLISRLKKKKPNAMHNIYDAGHMFTEFHKDNKHVRERIYQLNGDVYCVYYITEKGQMIVMSYDLPTLHKAERLFSTEAFRDYASLLDKIDFQQAILYEFVYSQYDDFYEFLKDIDH